MDQKSNGMATKGGEKIKGKTEEEMEGRYRGRGWDILGTLCPRQGRLGWTVGELHPTRDELSF